MSSPRGDVLGEGECPPSPAFPHTPFPHLPLNPLAIDTYHEGHLAGKGVGEGERRQVRASSEVGGGGGGGQRNFGATRVGEGQDGEGWRWWWAESHLKAAVLKYRKKRAENKNRSIYITADYPSSPATASRSPSITSLSVLLRLLPPHPVCRYHQLTHPPTPPLTPGNGCRRCL